MSLMIGVSKMLLISVELAEKKFCLYLMAISLCEGFQVYPKSIKSILLSPVSTKSAYVEFMDQESIPN